MSRHKYHTLLLRRRPRHRKLDNLSRVPPVSEGAKVQNQVFILQTLRNWNGLRHYWEEDVVCPYSGIYYSALKGREFWHALQQGWTWRALMLSEIRHKNELWWSHLCEAPGVVRCIEEESRRVVAMGWEEGSGELLNGYRVLSRKMKVFWRWMVVVAQQHECT